MLRLLPLLLLAAPLAAADPVPEPWRVADNSAFPKALAVALGDHFEYLGGEPARIKTSMGSAAAERFWVARVKAKTPGWYVFRYSIRFHFPARLAAGGRRSEGAEYTFHVAVGEPGSVRVFAPGAYGGSAFPHLNAGDTLLIPVHTDLCRVDHRFEPVRAAANDPVLSVLGDRKDARYLKGAADPPAVRNTAGRTKLLASWTGSFGNRPGTATHHSLGAYLELTAPGTFNLSGRLAAGEAGTPDVPFRVLPKDRPAAVLLESVGFVEHTGKSRYHTTNAIRPGTLEARVGDRVAVGCGGYVTGGLTPADPTKTGVVEALPFRDAPNYEPR
jgi:hypothetical protein